MRELAALLMALAAFAVARTSTPQAAERRIRRRTPVPSASRPSRDVRALALNAASLTFGAACLLLIPFPAGAIAAPIVVWAARRMLRRLPPPEPAGISVHLLAGCADLLAACLEAGAVPADALTATGACLPEPLSQLISRAGRALADGIPVEQALPGSGPLAPISAVFRRSSRTGSAMTEQLIAVAEQLREDDQFDRLERAQRVGVLSALPLGLCMLPAFLLLAVVPAVVGLGPGLLL